MIGDVPKGAPLRCRLGRHTGQENGGTMVFTCPRCGGSFWQAPDVRDLTGPADARLTAGEDPELVLRETMAEVRRRTR